MKTTARIAKVGDRVLLIKQGRQMLAAPHTGTVLNVREAYPGVSRRYTVRRDGRKGRETWAQHMWRVIVTP